MSKGGDSGDFEWRVGDLDVEWPREEREWDSRPDDFEGRDCGVGSRVVFAMLSDAIGGRGEKENDKVSLAQC